MKQEFATFLFLSGSFIIVQNDPGTKRKRMKKKMFYACRSHTRFHSFILSSFFFSQMVWKLRKCSLIKWSWDKKNEIEIESCYNSLRNTPSKDFLNVEQTPRKMVEKGKKKINKSEQTLENIPRARATWKKNQDFLKIVSSSNWIEFLTIWLSTIEKKKKGKAKKNVLRCFLGWVLNIYSRG